MTRDEIKAKAEEFFEWPDERRDVVTYTSALLFAEECVKAASCAPWLTEAHMLCSDMGIPQGQISWRLKVLRELLFADAGKAGSVCHACDGTGIVE